MQIFSKAVVFVLLSAVLAAPLAAQGFLLSAGAQEPPAGCHEDSGKPPAPGPCSHQCCLGSHHPAILQQSSSSRPPLQVSPLVDFRPQSVAVNMRSNSPNRVIVPGDPPATSPLRL
jgi:hypothetical protein